MNWNQLFEKLTEINTKDRVYRNEPMKKHTNFRLGGPAALLVIPETESALIATVKTLRGSQVPMLLIGNGTNLLIRDGGFPGVVVKINHQGMKMVTLEGTKIDDNTDVPGDTTFSNMQFLSGLGGSTVPIVWGQNINGNAPLTQLRVQIILNPLSVKLHTAN